MWRQGSTWIGCRIRGRCRRWEVLAAPYHPPVERVGPLAQLKARNGLMPFLGRGELDTLRVWCEAEPVGVAVVYGSGGSGKTHLAAELCRRLADEGWYAGFLSKSDRPGGSWSGWPRWCRRFWWLLITPRTRTRSCWLVLWRCCTPRRADSPGWVLFTARARTTGGWQDNLSKRLERQSSAADQVGEDAAASSSPHHRGVPPRLLRLRWTASPGRRAAAAVQHPAGPRWTW